MRSGTFDIAAIAVLSALGFLAFIVMQLAQFLGSDFFVTLKAFLQTLLALGFAVAGAFIIGNLPTRYYIGLAVWVSFFFWFPVINNIAETMTPGARMYLEYGVGTPDYPWWSTNFALFGASLLLAVGIIYFIRYLDD